MPSFERDPAFPPKSESTKNSAKASADTERHLERARTLRRESSPPERLIWSRLRAGRGGPKFRRQHPLGPYTVDFYCAAARLVIEIDGSQHASQRRTDVARDAWMKSQGETVLRIHAYEVVANLDAVVQRINLTARRLTDEAG